MRYIILLTFLTLLSCSGDEGAISGHTDAFSFEDGFEVTESNFTELFPSDGSRWTTLQIVSPESGNNEISISDEITREGVNSLKIIAQPSGAILSKADIEKGGFSAPVGSKIRIEADFFINTTENIKDLLLIDLECCSCWDPNVPDNTCPGIRLMMSGSDDYLSIERGKILGSTIIQNDTPFPRQEWVTIIWKMILSPENDGQNSLQINGEEVISESAMNMPNALMFKNEAAKNDIEFELQEPLFYERIQIGSTANPTSQMIEMYVDNFKMSIE